MATQKPISTISYNTEPFLREKLQALLDAHIIQAYQYICHIGEDGDKNHIHLRVEPNKKLDPMDLTEFLKEFEKGKDKPLGVRPWRPSKEEDWFLYAVHDPDYLKLKYGGGEKGEKLQYGWEDIKVPEFYDLEVAFVRARQSLRHSTTNLAVRMQKGDRPLDMILEGENPYVVNALMRAVSQNDYMRLQEDLMRAQCEIADLMSLIRGAGFVVEIDENGNKVLKEKEDISLSQ